MLLILIPWSAFWDRNYFVESVPSLHALLTNNFVRGAISGLGVVNLLAALGALAAGLALYAVGGSRSPAPEGES